MMTCSLVVKNGTLLTEEGELDLDLGVEDGRIAAISPRGTLQGEKEIDAGGLLVLPGGIDTHVHFEDPGMTDWEDWEHASLAAAKGGITTVVDMPVDGLPPVTDAASLRFKEARALEHSQVDFLLWGGLTPDNLTELTGMLDLGAAGLKAFLAECGGPYFSISEGGTLYEGMRILSQYGLPLTLHCEDGPSVDFYTARQCCEKAFQNEDWDHSRPVLCELLAVNQALFLSRRTGCRINIAHISCAEVADLIAEGRRQGIPVTAETCAHYLYFSGADVQRRGTILKCSPPIRKEARDGLWECLKDGRIDFVASDHSPTSRELREKDADDMFKGSGGISGVQFTLQVLYSEGVLKHGLSTARLCSVFSANAARMLGIYGQKGSLRQGFDADFVLFDPAREQTIQPEDYLAKVPVSPYIGETFQGAVAATYLRGECIYRAGEPAWPFPYRARMLSAQHQN